MNYRIIFLSLFIIIGVLGPPKIWGGSNQAWFDTKPNHITPGTMDSGQLDVTIENCQLSWFGLINVLTYTLLGMVGP